MKLFQTTKISFGVNDNSFPKVMRIMAGKKKQKKTSFLTSTEALRSWGLFIRTVNIILRC